MEREIRKILVIAPHPDDETLGCGGTIRRWADEGHEVYWLICTQFYRHGKTDEQITIRNNEITLVAQVLGITKRYELKHDAALITYPDIGKLVGEIAQVVKEVEPDTLLLPNRSDVHTDHQIIFKAGMSCTKNFNYPFIKTVLMYETISETDFAPALAEDCFLPNVFVDITGYIHIKLEAMKVYKSELMPLGFPRSLEAIRALSVYRGAAIGKQNAEAFMLLKQIYG